MLKTSSNYLSLAQGRHLCRPFTMFLKNVYWLLVPDVLLLLSTTPLQEFLSLALHSIHCIDNFEAARTTDFVAGAMVCASTEHPTDQQCELCNEELAKSVVLQTIWPLRTEMIREIMKGCQSAKEWKKKHENVTDC